MPEGCHDKVSSVVKSHYGVQVSSSVSPQAENHRAGVNGPTNQSTVTCILDSVVRDPEFIDDDVPAENLLHPVEGGQFLTLF